MDCDVYKYVYLYPVATLLLGAIYIILYYPQCNMSSLKQV